MKKIKEVLNEIQAVGECTTFGIKGGGDGICIPNCFRTPHVFYHQKDL